MGNENSSPAAPRKGPEVHLNVYVNTDAKTGKTGFQMPGFGVYHSGIEIGGTEYTYAGSAEAQGSGVQSQRPRETPSGSQWVFKESVALGKTDLTSKEVAAVISKLRGDFPANKYDLITCNCNHFTEMTSHLLNLKYPSWVNRAAKVGGAFKGGVSPLEEHKMKQAVAEQQRAQQQQQQQRKQEVQTKLKAKQQSLAPEPDASTTPAEHIHTIQLNLPNGSKARRTFLNSATLRDVMEFATCHDDTLPAASKFVLSSNFPKKEFTDTTQTLVQAGLSRSENLYVRVKR